MKNYFWIEAEIGSKVVSTARRCGLEGIPDDIVMKAEMTGQPSVVEEYVFKLINRQSDIGYMIMPEDKFKNILDAMGYKKREEECRALVPTSKAVKTINFKCCECHDVLSKNVMKQEAWFFCRTCRCNTLWKRTDEPIKMVFKEKQANPIKYFPPGINFGEFMKLKTETCVTCLKPITQGSPSRMTKDGPKHFSCAMGYIK